jgi:polynucleotide 5'-kinase involved in rRNA processing
MPTDKHGVTHAGTIGLFDDEQENYVSVERSERHEIEHLQSQIRRHEGRQERKEHREQRAANRAAKGKS